MLWASLWLQVVVLVVLSTSQCSSQKQMHLPPLLLASSIGRRYNYINISCTSFLCKCWWRLLSFCFHFRFYFMQAVSYHLNIFFFFFNEPHPLLSSFNLLINLSSQYIKTFNQHNLCFPVITIVIQLCSLIYGLQVLVQSVKEHLSKEGIEVRI